MRWFGVLFLFLNISGCTDTNKTPRGIIPRDKMEKVLWDMILADRYSAQFLARDSAKLDVKAETFKLYEQVFQLHHVSHEQFIKSFKYYLNRPDITRSMFDSLVVNANRRREEIYRSRK